MDQSAIPETRLGGISVIVSDNNMIGYIKLEKKTEEEGQSAGQDKAEDDNEVERHELLTEDRLKQALKEKGITFGIKEDNISMLVKRPIYGLKIEVAKGEAPVDGEDGHVEFYVKRDSEYKPEYKDEEKIDFKNLEHFQQVTEGQMLCKIIKETDGKSGKNVFGTEVPARRGRPPVSPFGKNTVFNEDGTILFAAKNGVVRFLKDHIDINEVMQIRSSVDHMTGNIRFPGDVIIDGDVRNGFSVRSGGSIIIKGVVEGAYIEADGDISIGKGINGSGGEKVIAGGNLKSGYIESARLQVEGNITTDYIIESDIKCGGDITLIGRNELIIGGSIKLSGELTAKFIGNERERPTRIEIIGIVFSDVKGIEEAKKERDEYTGSAAKLVEILKQFDLSAELDEDDPRTAQISLLKQQLSLFKQKIDAASLKIKRLEDESRIEYPGAVKCKKKIYQGVKIYFGNDMFQFDLDDIENSRIFWSDGEIIHGAL